jgi:hypothetical protein
MNVKTKEIPKWANFSPNDDQSGVGSGDGACRVSKSHNIRKKYSEKDLKELRARYPDMNDKEFRENYAYYDWGSGLGMKFEGGKLTYLTLSVAETN